MSDKRYNPIFSENKSEEIQVKASFDNVKHLLCNGVVVTFNPNENLVLPVKCEE